MGERIIMSPLYLPWRSSPRAVEARLEDDWSFRREPGGILARRRAVILKCPSCGKKNRSPAQRLTETGRCGACKTEISPVGAPIDADPETFREVTSSARVPVLVDFWAAWCGPCKMSAPEVARTAADMKGRAIVLKVDTDAHPEL